MWRATRITKTLASQLRSTNMSDKTINIDIVSDNVCPWCFVGKQNLEKAIQSAPEYSFNVNWKPYFLRPDTPKEGFSIDVLKRQYPQFDQMQQHLKNVGEKAGIKFVDRTRIPNTLTSHRLVYYASKHNLQNDVITALFHAYFEEGKDIGNNQVLADIAKSVGLDAVAVKTYLDSDEDQEAVKQEALGAKAQRISGVPHFTLSKPGSTASLSISGGQPPHAFLEAFKKL